MSRHVLEVNPGFAQSRARAPADVVAVIRKAHAEIGMVRLTKAARVSENTVLEAVTGGRLTPPALARLEAYARSREVTP